jgi:hypothetical protein
MDSAFDLAWPDVEKNDKELGTACQQLCAARKVCCRGGAPHSKPHLFRSDCNLACNFILDKIVGIKV